MVALGLRLRASCCADGLPEREGQLDRDDDRHRLALPHARTEAPHLGGLDRLLIEAEDRVERARDLDLADADRRASRCTRARPSPGPWRASRRRCRPASLRASRAASVMPAPGRYAPPPVPPPNPGPRPEPCPDPMPCARCRCRRRHPCPALAIRSLAPTAGSRPATSSPPTPSSSRESSAPQAAARPSAARESAFGFFSTGTVIFSLPGSSALRGGSGDLLPPPPPPPPGPGTAIQTMSLMARRG